MKVLQLIQDWAAEVTRAECARREALLEYAFTLAIHNAAPVTVLDPEPLYQGQDRSLRWDIPAGVRA